MWKRRHPNENPFFLLLGTRKSINNLLVSVIFSGGEGLNNGESRQVVKRREDGKEWEDEKTRDVLKAVETSF